MRLMTVDPRALEPNPDPMRRTPATPQADALLLATIKAVGIVQPPIISPQQDGGNGYYIQHGHRRVSQAIAAELAEIEVLVADPETDKDALRAVVENVAREGKNPVDLWRSIERLVGLAPRRHHSAGLICSDNGPHLMWKAPSFDPDKLSILGNRLQE
jgi:ParB family chromosome partitioning protein